MPQQVKIKLDRDLHNSATIHSM